MSDTDSPRLGCLVLPHFPIDVDERRGRVERGSSWALTQGRDKHARVVAVSPVAWSHGVRPGQRLASARGLDATLRLCPWEEGAMRAASRSLADLLDPLTPHHQEIGPGRWLVEVFGEAQAFGQALIDLAGGVGFTQTAVGMADGSVAAGLAALWEGPGIYEVPPGGDGAYLAALSIDVLPLGARLHRILKALGLRQVGMIQALSVADLCARLGPDGARLGALVRGLDTRRVWSPRASVSVRRDIPFPIPCEGLTSVRFALRAAVADVAREVASQVRAIGCLEITIVREGGEDLVWRITPARPTHDGALLWHLVEARLRRPHGDVQGADERGGWILGVRVEAVDTELHVPTQLSLFSSPEAATDGVEVALARVAGRLGGGALCRARGEDGHLPERSGRWQSALERDPPDARIGAAPSSPDEPRACVRRLNPPEPLIRVDGGFQRSAAHGPLRVLRWMGPEGLSGRWWRGEGDRDYYWGVLEGGRVAWLFQERRGGAWFLQGWLD